MAHSSFHCDSSILGAHAVMSKSPILLQWQEEALLVLFILFQISSTPAYILVDNSIPNSISWIVGIKLSTRIPAGVDDSPCFLYF